MLDDLAFNITLEILQGCGFSCTDCAIDKNFTPDQLLDNDVLPMLDLVDGMQELGYNLTEFTIGPTDLISARNGLAMLDHPLVVGLAERYDSLTVNLALLSDAGLEEFAAKINVLMKGKAFRVGVPMTLKNIQNPKFVALVLDRIATIRKGLPDVEFKTLYLNLPMIGQTAAHFDGAANALVQSLDFGVPKLVEFTFPHSRKDFSNLMVAEELKRDLNLFATGINECSDTTDNYYLVPPTDDSFEVTYRNGNLYYTPFLIEKFPIFDERFVIPKPWGSEAVISFKECHYFDNMIKYMDDPICKGCCFLDQCARGGIHSVMDQVGATTCILNMKNRWDLAPRQ
jgi:hypothetical protein